MTMDKITQVRVSFKISIIKLISLIKMKQVRLNQKRQTFRKIPARKNKEKLTLGQIRKRISQKPNKITKIRRNNKTMEIMLKAKIKKKILTKIIKKVQNKF